MLPVSAMMKAYDEFWAQNEHLKKVLQKVQRQAVLASRSGMSRIHVEIGTQDPAPDDDEAAYIQWAPKLVSGGEASDYLIDVDDISFPNGYRF